jgi:hypothetical protein
MYLFRKRETAEGLFQAGLHTRDDGDLSGDSSTRIVTGLLIVGGGSQRTCDLLFGMEDDGCSRRRTVIIGVIIILSADFPFGLLAWLFPALSDPSLCL